MYLLWDMPLSLLVTRLSLTQMGFPHCCIQYPPLLVHFAYGKTSLGLEFNSLGRSFFSVLIKRMLVFVFFLSPQFANCHAFPAPSCLSSERRGNIEKQSLLPAVVDFLDRYLSLDCPSFGFWRSECPFLCLPRRLSIWIPIYYLQCSCFSFFWICKQETARLLRR